MDAQPGGEALVQALREMDCVAEAELSEGLAVARASEDVRGQVARRLMESGFTVTHLRQRGGDLDEIYARYFEKAGENDAGKRENGKAGQRKRA